MAIVEIMWFYVETRAQINESKIRLRADGYSASVWRQTKARYDVVGEQSCHKGQRHLVVQVPFGDQQWQGVLHTGDTSPDSEEILIRFHPGRRRRMIGTEAGYLV